MKKKPAAKRSKKKAPPVAIEPSHISGRITARRMGRPSKLTRALIAEFLEHLSLGLHLQHCAALVGLPATQLSDHLKDGRRDAIAGKRSIAAEFSEAVRAKLAGLQQQELASLAVYQRIAEGWSPTCKACLAKSTPCGKHPQNLRLAADLSRWRLVHRFPREWNAQHVNVGLDGGDDTGSSGEEGGGRPVVAAMVVFMPKRNDDV